MKAVWALFWPLLSLRAGPEDVPYSPPLLWLLLVTSILAGLTGQWLSRPEHWQASLGITLIAAAVDALALWLLLHFKGLPERFVQSLSAVYGADTLLTVLSLPVLVLGLLAQEKSALWVMGGFLSLLLTGWSLGVRGFIYHRALNLGIFQGNMLSLALLLVTMALGLHFFPELLRPPA